MQDPITQIRRQMPTPIELAKLISQITRDILGVECTFVKGRRNPQEFFRAAQLDLGDAATAIAMAADFEGGHELAALWFDCDTRQIINRHMVGDTLAELGNQVAGRVVNALGITRPLVPPTNFDDPAAMVASRTWRYHGMRVGAAEFTFCWSQEATIDSR